MANAYALIKQSSVGSLTDTKSKQAYLKALNYFWHGQGNKVIDFTSSCIVAGEHNDELLPLYRLWLEQLAGEHEHAAIRDLITHFYHMGRAPGARPQAWLALRALAHLELDDWEACELFAPSLLTNSEEPYSLEFALRFHLRTWDGRSPLPVTFVSKKSGLGDFFHWQTLSQALLINGQEDELIAVLAHSSKLFPNSPLEDWFHAHRNLEAGRYGEAVKHSRRLTLKYPRKLDYHVLDAYSALQAKQTTPAISALEKALELKGGRSDADVWTLLAACYEQRTEERVNKADAKRAQACARKALAMRRRHGLPYHDLLNRYGAAGNQPGRKNSKVDLDWERDGGPLQQWLVKLSPRRAHEFALAADDDVTSLVQAMGRQVRTDDLVFIAYPSPAGASKSNAAANEPLRILALYAVATRPQWDPQSGQVVSLKLLKKFSEPLVVTLEEADLMPARGRGRHRRTAVGCYHLGEDSFQAISAGVHTLAEEGEEWRRVMTVARSS